MDLMSSIVELVTLRMVGEFWVLFCEKTKLYFVSDKCGWLDKVDKLSPLLSSPGWYVVQANKKYFVGPNVDGSNNTNGHYILLFNSRSSYVDSATLIRNDENYNVQFKHAYVTCMMKFDYYLASNCTMPYANIEVSLGNTYDSAVPVTQLYNRIPKWQKAEVFIGSYVSTFVIEIRGSKKHNNETVAIDNIEFVNCSQPDPLPPTQSCQNGQVMCNTTRICIDPEDFCDFEDNCGDNFDEQYSICSPYLDPKVVPRCAFEKSMLDCGFSTDPTLTVIFWTVSQTSNYNFKYLFGPGSDHTT